MNKVVPGFFFVKAELSKEAHFEQKKKIAHSSTKRKTFTRQKDYSCMFEYKMQCNKREKGVLESFYMIKTREKERGNVDENEKEVNGKVLRHLRPEYNRV